MRNRFKKITTFIVSFILGKHCFIIELIKRDINDNYNSTFFIFRFFTSDLQLEYIDNIIRYLCLIF